jgi:PhoPQ-activated pathogenicity-related protein
MFANRKNTMRRTIGKISLIVITALSINVNASTALQDYVDRKDGNFAWNLVKQQSNDQGTEYILRMSSQAWLTKKEVNQPVWKHWMAVYVPNTVEHETAFLLIGGGENSELPPKHGSTLLAQMAVQTKSVTARILNVPNQPLIFKADKEQRQRVEDDILAWCWARYLTNEDPKWLTLLPMTKSAVRAMDTVSAFCKILPDKSVTVNKFVVSGMSKRGWTTWLSAAADKRVVAIAPQVIDLLNMKLSMEHHRKAYGKFSRAVHPYVENGIMDAMNTPESESSLEIIDPWSYRKTLTIPKLILNSTGDQFFLPDSSQFYYSQLPEPKYLRFVPNTSHGLDRTAGETLISFYASILKNRALPAFKWATPESNKIVVTTEENPMEVKLWKAVNPTARDFREETIGKTWQCSPLPQSGQSNKQFRYEVTIPKPAQGWAAFYVECIFNDHAQGRLSLTTEVSVIPTTLPYAEK